MSDDIAETNARLLVVERKVDEIVGSGRARDLVLAELQAAVTRNTESHREAADRFNVLTEASDASAREYLRTREALDELAGKLDELPDRISTLCRLVRAWRIVTAPIVRLMATGRGWLLVIGSIAAAVLAVITVLERWFPELL